MFGSVIFAKQSKAERCWMVGGCENGVVYVYVPKTQYDNYYKEKYGCDSKIFKQNGLPKTGSKIEFYNNDYEAYTDINHIGAIYNKYKEQKEELLKKYSEVTEKCTEISYMLRGGSYMLSGTLSGGMKIGGGMKAEIISYLKLKEGLFALVKILTS